MKKILKGLATSFLILTMLALPEVSKAATIGMAPAKVTVHVGDTFNINFTASGKGTKNYTVQINARFTQNIISFTKWQWRGGENLIPLKTAGYNVLDNSTGTIIQTTGYVGGFSDLVNLADVTFTANKVGQGIISLTGDSFSYDETGTSTYVPGNNTVVNIEVLPVAKKAVKKTSPAVVPTTTPTTPPVEAPTSNQTPAQTGAITSKPEAVSTIIPKTVTVQVPIPAPEDTDLFSLNNLIYLLVGIILGIILVKIFETITPDLE